MAQPVSFMAHRDVLGTACGLHFPTRILDIYVAASGGNDEIPALGSGHAPNQRYGTVTR
jgi:hypothetical protein